MGIEHRVNIQVVLEKGRQLIFGENIDVVMDDATPLKLKIKYESLQYTELTKPGSDSRYFIIPSSKLGGNCVLVVYEGK